MVHETRSRVHAAAQEEGKLASKKQKSENEDQERGHHVPSKNKKSADNKGQDGEAEAPTKSNKLKADESEPNGREAAARDFAEFCKAIGEHLSLEDMRKILEANEQDASGSEDAVVPRCEDMMFYGPLEKCPVCGGQLEFKGWKYKCTGNYSEWARCTFSTNDPSRKSGPIKVPDDIKDDFIRKWLKPRFSLSEIKIYRRSWINRISKIYRKYRTKFKKNSNCFEKIP